MELSSRNSGQGFSILPNLYTGLKHLYELTNQGVMGSFLRSGYARTDNNAKEAARHGF